MNMSMKALDWAFKVDREDVSSTMKFILLVLADHADSSNVATPRQSTIAKRTCLTREAVNRNIGKLADIGLIKVNGRKDDHGSVLASAIELQINQ
jgi:DNA-binding MarR family transcriptional regulator